MVWCMENIVGRFIKKPAAKVTTTSRRAGICKMKLAWASALGNAQRRIRTSRACADAAGTSPQPTLWASDPRQQLAYLAVKRWARLYCPDVIPGSIPPMKLTNAKKGLSTRRRQKRSR